MCKRVCAMLCAGLALGSMLADGILARADEPIVWDIDNLQRIGGHSVTVIGSPRVVQSDKGRAVEFDGKGDGLLIESNPLEGLRRFTVEVLFQPAPDGGEEQRFVHFQEATGENRALIELRLTAKRFALDTYLRSPEPGLTLIDRARTHAAGEWHVASLTYDGKTMAHAVDRVRELSGDVAFTPLTGGRTSIGMRQNRVSFFKGRIRSIRVVPEAEQVIALWPEGVPNGKKGGGEERIVDGRVYNVQSPP